MVAVMKRCLPLFLSCFAALGPSCASSTQEASARKPNVVVVITDDQGYGDIAAHGNRMIKTPHLDRLHAESVRLTDFHVDPTCSPSRSALMTGRYSTRTGVWHTIMGRSLMNSAETTMAEVFAAGGYRCGMVGKWHLGENYPLRPQDQGFHEAFYHGGGGVGQGPDWWGNDYFDDTYFRNGKPEKAEGYCTDVWFDDALRFVEEHKDSPFFLYLSTNAPHGPYLVGDEWSKPYVDAGVPQRMAKFYGMITNIDHNIGRLRSRLDDLGLAKDTIFVFMTDNGTAAGEIRNRRAGGEWKGFNAGMRGYKGSEYDGGHRVPLFVAWPRGGLAGGRDVDPLCAHIDVLPTLAELCGLDLVNNPRIDGRSLVRSLRGDQEDLRSRTLFVHSQRIPTPKKWRKCAVMTKRWRLVNGTKLYDISADPAQRKDLAESMPTKVAELRAAYEGWWRSLSPAFGERVRIGLGAPSEPRAQLHPHDWHVGPRDGCPWHQNHVKRGYPGNGFWAVDVLKAGKYEFELRRWPEHVGGGVEATKARVRVGKVEAEKACASSDPSVRVVLDLPRGPARLQTWFTTLKGKSPTRGAYFVYVRKL